MDKGTHKRKDSNLERSRERISRYVEPARVVCDKFTCLDRGEYPRCYEDSFKDCPYYLLGDHHYSDADIKMYREIKSINRRLNGNKNNRRE